MDINKFKEVINYYSVRYFGKKDDSIRPLLLFSVNSNNIDYINVKNHTVEIGKGVHEVNSDVETADIYFYFES